MLMTMPETSNYMKLSRATIERMVRDGKLPVVRIGARVLFRKKSLDEFIERAEQSPRMPKMEEGFSR